MSNNLLTLALQGDFRSLARCITLIENELDGYEEMMRNLPITHQAPLIGITGPPGAGKSTLTDSLIELILKENKKVAVLCVDPSSPFSKGALLGDRIRMREWYNHPSVYIRSMASRGALGGLHPMIIEIAELLRVAPFDFVLVETVGVGQSEVEIASLADLTIVVLVPESGDEVQTMKAGLMEIADIFVINKADRPEADLFAQNLLNLQLPASAGLRKPVPVIKTVATEKRGVEELFQAIKDRLPETNKPEIRLKLMTEKAMHLIGKQKMKGLNKEELTERINQELKNGKLNLYQLIGPYI